MASGSLVLSLKFPLFKCLIQGVSKKVAPKVKLLPFSQFLSKVNETV